MYHHYTNIESLFHIILTKKVWFNSLAFMNDDLEGFDLHRVMAEVMNLKNEGDEFKGKMFFVDSTIQESLRLQLIFSASSLRDDISQWRAYTTLGQGVCISFEDGLFEGNPRKVECLYSFPDKKAAILEDLYLSANDKELATFFDPKDGGGTKAIRECIVSITESLVRFKSSSFSPENETRWVLHASCMDNVNSDMKYRPHRLGLTPYEEVPIDLNKIRRITLGPQVPPQNIKTMQDFCKSKDCLAKIQTSEVSLR